MYSFLSKLESIERKLDTVATYRSTYEDGVNECPKVHIPKVPGIPGLPPDLCGKRLLTTKFATTLATSSAGITSYTFINDFVDPHFVVNNDANDSADDDFSLPKPEQSADDADLVSNLDTDVDDDEDDDEDDEEDEDD